MRVRTFAAACGVLLAMAVVAAGGTYNGVQTISDPTDELGATTYIGNTGTDTVITVSSGGSLYNLGSNGLQVANGAGTEAKLVIDGGVVGDDGTTYTRRTVALGYGGTAYVEIKNGGTLYGATGYFGRLTGCAVTVDLSSGLLDISGNAYFGYAADSTVAYTQSGGTANFASNVNIGYAGGSSGTISISGGTVNFLKQVYVGDADSLGRFEVIGSAASIFANATMSTTNRWYMYANQSTLSFILDDSANHISCINAFYTNISGGTIDMGLSGFTPTDGQTFDLLKDWDGTIVITNLVLASGDEYIDGVQSGWTLQRNDDGDTLQAVYHVVPEPASMVLLGAGVLGLTLKRRRSA